MTLREITEQEVYERLVFLRDSKTLALRGYLNWAKATDAQKAAAVRDAAALCNCGGGWLVYGARAGEFSGLDEAEWNSFEEASFNEFLGVYLQPELKCRLIKAELSSGKRVVIIEVPDFSDTPVVCFNPAETENRKMKVLEAGAVYMRSEEGLSDKISSAAKMKELLIRAVNKRVRALKVEKEGDKLSLYEVGMASSYFSESFGQAFGKGGYWEIVVYPVFYEKDRTGLFEISALFESARAKDSMWFFRPSDVKVFPGGLQYAYTTPKTLECARLYKSGVFVWRMALNEDYGTSGMAGASGEKVLGLENAAALLTRFFLFAHKFYSRSYLGCGIRAEIAVYGSSGRRLVALSPYYDVDRDAVCEGEFVKIERNIGFDEISLVRRNAVNAALEFVTLFGWRDAPEAKRCVIKLVEAEAARCAKAFPGW